MGNLQAASKALGAMKFLLLSLLFASQAASAVVENSVEEDDVEGEVALLETSDASDIPKDRCGVVVAINEDERLELFTLGHDNLIYHKCQLTAEEWSNWANLGGLYIRGGPSIVRNADGRLQMFVRGRATTTAVLRSGASGHP